MAPVVSSRIERRKYWKKAVQEDRDEVLVEVCVSMEKTCDEVKSVKDNVSSIKDDVSDIKTEMTGMKTEMSDIKVLLNKHIDHHPSMRMKERTTPEKIWVKRYDLLGLVITGVVSVIVAFIGVRVVGG